MKKIVSSILILFVATTTFAQIKHNKFTTLITFDTLNPIGIFGQTAVTELKDNSGYFLTNFYDNQSGGFNPSLVKLNVDGDVVMDSIYNFSPNNTSFTNFVGAVTKTTSHTALYSTGALQALSGVDSPYIINFDLNGNINWHSGFSDDSLTLESQKIIVTQDGGYLIAGKLYDSWIPSARPSGFAIKLDAMGAIQWNKLYTNTDTMNLTFSDAIELKNGDYFFVGQAENRAFAAKILTPDDRLVTIIRTDNVGNNIWNKGFVFDAPIDNTIGFGEISTGMINDSTAYVFCSVMDSSNFENYIAIASINVNTGTQNWTNYYAPPISTTNISAANSLGDGNGNIIVTINDFYNNTSVLFKIDGTTGNIINTKRHVLGGGASNNSESLIKTLDGGYVQINNISLNQVLMVKSDKFLDVSCPDIDSSYLSLTAIPSIDTSYFGFVDSVYSWPGLVAQSLSPLTPFNSESSDSLICSCSNTITGTVLDGITPVNGATVYLFKKGTVPKPWAPIDSMVTNTSGMYQFYYVPTDSFLVKVKPNLNFNPNAIPSYHKHLDTCFRWERAGVFHVHCDSMNIVKDVALITPPALTGNSGLNGYVFEYTGSFSKQPGDPIPGIGITVEQSPGGVVGGSISGGNGYYDLSNLNNNSTYVVLIDYPGLPHDSIWTVSINLNDSILDSLNFYIDSTGIYIVGSLNTGIESINNGDLSIEVFPNPSSGSFNLNLVGTKSENIQLDIVNSVGKLIYSKTTFIKEGTNNIEIETTDFAQGVYFLKIRQGSNFYIKKLVKQ